MEIEDVAKSSEVGDSSGCNIEIFRNKDVKASVRAWKENATKIYWVRSETCKK